MESSKHLIMSITATPATRTAPTNIAEAANHRRSIRNYTNQAVSRSTIEELLTLAGRAPSAWNIQPWHVHVITDPEMKAKIQAVAPFNKQVGRAPAVLVVTSDMKIVLTRLDEALRHFPDDLRKSTVVQILQVFDAMPTPARDAWGRNQTYIFLGYLLLIAETMGLATSPMLGFDPAGVRGVLGLEGHVEIAALVAVGYAGEDGIASSRLPIEKISSFVN